LKKATVLLAVLTLGALLPRSAPAANGVRIHQVYGGGGTTGAIYRQDYIELFNFSSNPVNLGGWSIQYGTATGGVGFGGAPGFVSIIPAGSIGPVRTIGSALPTPDLVGNPALDISAAGGKLALVSSQTFPTGCSGNSVGGLLVDVVGWGNANCFEGVAAVPMTATTSLIRVNISNDTGDNTADFASAFPVPHNSSTPLHSGCLVTPARTNTWGELKLHYR
jgi:hypothetical protein